MKYFVSGIGALAICSIASGQYTTGFEAQSASATGVVLTGQDAWYIPPAAGGSDHNVFTYAGNSFGFPANATGGNNFEVGTSDGAVFGRAQRDIDFSAGGAWRISWDIAAQYNGTLPSAANLGSFSMQDSAAARYFQSLYNWMDVNTAAAWRVQFITWSCDGVTQTTASPSAAFDNLTPNHWYRVSVLFSFNENRVHEISITDLVTNQTSTANPVGWYLIGGRNSVARPLPTAIRHFVGGGAGNTVATDNLAIQTAAEPPDAGPCAPPPPPPANDLCGSSIAVGEGTFPFSLVASTGDGYSLCTNQFSTPDVWFTYTPTQSGTAVINTCETGVAGVDTVISVFDICPSLGGSEFYCADDGCNAYYGGSRAEVPVTAGQSWVVRVSNFSGLAGGAGNLNIHMSSPPANDACASATNVGEGVHAFTLLDSTNDGGTGPSCTTQTNTAPQDVWLRYTPSANGTATASMCGISTFDSVIAAYDTCGGTELACGDDTCGVGGGPSEITFAATAGQAVLIRFTEWEGGAYSSGQISISLAPACDPDVNCDGVPDQDDVACIILAVAGDLTCFCQADPDFNHDGVPDQDDVAAVILTVAGAPCP